MWIKPTIIKDKSNRSPSLFWTKIKENAYFEMEKNSAKTMLEKVGEGTYPYRIILKSEAPMAVAVANDERTIRNHWLTIESKLLKHLDVDHEYEKEEIFKFLELKCSSLAQVEDKPENSEQNKSEAFFQKTFGLHEEKFIAYYSCSLWRKVHCYGWIYLSENYLCFYSKMANNLVLAFKDITSMKKENHFFSNGIKLTTKDVEYYFSGGKRDELFAMMEQLWTSAMERLLETAENTMQKLSVVAMRDSFPEFPSVPATPRTPESPMTPSKSSSISRRTRGPGYVENMPKETRKSEIRKVFKLPTEENILIEVTFPPVASLPSTVKGLFIVSHNFTCFCDRSLHDYTIKVVFAFKEVHAFSEDFRDKQELISVDHKTGKWVFQLVQPVDMTVCRNMWQVAKAKKENTASFIEFYEKRKDIPFYDEEQQAKKQLWDKYFTKFGQPGISMIWDPSLQELFEGGTPEHIRAQLWHYCTGAAHKWIVRPGYYFELLKDTESEFNMIIDNIDKDLHRSFPGHPFFQKRENLEKLRRVLVAYSLKNPVIGYCQSMNVVCALLLIGMSEEAAFWMLTTICEDLVPEYYSKALVGSIVDQQLFEQLLEKHMPDIANHFRTLGISVGIISCAWFMCLFIGFVPLEGSFRILDLLFYEGKNVLQKIALGIFKMNKDTILEQKDGVQLVKILKEQVNINYNELIKVAIEDFKNLAVDVSELRNSNKWKAIKDLENINKLSQIRYLEGATEYRKEELEALHSVYERTLPVNGVQTGINFKQFCFLLGEVVPAWLELNLQHQVWKSFGEAEEVDFNEFVILLSKLQKGSLAIRLDYCMRLFDHDLDGKIDQNQLSHALEALKALYNKEGSKPDLQLFARMIFDKHSEGSGSGETLRLEDIAMELIDKPLLAEYLQLRNPPKSTPHTRQLSSAGVKLKIEEESRSPTSAARRLSVAW